MNSRTLVLAADGIGCTAAAGVLISSRSFAGILDPTLRSRVPAAVALGATAATLLAGAARPTDRALALATGINIAWVAVCLGALPLQRSPWGTALLVGTAVFDGAAALAQRRLRTR